MKKLKNILPYLIINIMLLPLLILNVNNAYPIELPYWGAFAILVNIAFLNGKMKKVARTLMFATAINFVVYWFLYFYNMLDVISFTFSDLYNLKIGNVNAALAVDLLLITIGLFIPKKKEEAEALSEEELAAKKNRVDSYNIPFRYAPAKKSFLKRIGNFFRDYGVRILLYVFIAFLLSGIFFMVRGCSQDIDKTYNEAYHETKYELLSLENDYFNCDYDVVYTKLEFVDGAEIKTVYTKRENIKVKLRTDSLVNHFSVNCDDTEFLVDETNDDFKCANDGRFEFILYLGQDAYDSYVNNINIVWVDPVVIESEEITLEEDEVVSEFLEKNTDDESEELVFKTRPIEYELLEVATQRYSDTYLIHFKYIDNEQNLKEGVVNASRAAIKVGPTGKAPYLYTNTKDLDKLASDDSKVIVEFYVGRVGADRLLNNPPPQISSVYK